MEHVASLLAAVLLAAPAPVVVGAAANGTTVRVQRGGELVVRLAGNPTTGYLWSAAHVPASLRLLSTRYVAPKPQRLGQGGTYVFRLRAVGGHGTLTLAYRRPWERGKRPLRSFVLGVRVR